jgi:hypothetical protein
MASAGVHPASFTARPQSKTSSIESKGARAFTSQPRKLLFVSSSSARDFIGRLSSLIS